MGVARRRDRPLCTPYVAQPCDRVADLLDPPACIQCNTFCFRPERSTGSARFLNRGADRCMRAFGKNCRGSPGGAVFFWVCAQTLGSVFRTGLPHEAFTTSIKRESWPQRLQSPQSNSLVVFSTKLSVQTRFSGHVRK